MMEGFSKVIDPNDAFGHLDKKHLIEMCGIVPNFFIKSVMNSDDDFDNIIEGMDQEYGFGGFGAFPFNGKVKGNKYISPDKGDSDLDALTVSRYRTEDGNEKFKMYQFQYGIVAVEDVPSGKTKIARFD